MKASRYHRTGRGEKKTRERKGVLYDARPQRSCDAMKERDFLLPPCYDTVWRDVR